MKNERAEFEKKFDADSKEYLVLTRDSMGAGKAGAADLWNASITLLAYIDIQTDTLIQQETRLTWQLTDKECKTKEMVYNFEKEHIYRLKVRESFPFVDSYNGETIPRGSRLMVVEVLERECTDSRLEKILADFQVPVTIDPEGWGELLLNKSFGMFDGNGYWNDEPCLIHLDVDDKDALTAEDACATLHKLLSDCKKWDEQARKYAASELTDTANDWQAEDDEEAEEITEESFAERLSVSELCISTDGDFEIFYDDDDMFWGHVIIVSGNVDDGLNDATFAG